MIALFDETKYTQWFVTDRGDILSKTTYRSDGKLKKLYPNINKERGYLYARTSNRNYQIHRLVASAFIDNPFNKPCVNHKDSNRHNNIISNLEWVTHQENTDHAIQGGRMRPLKKNEGNLKYTNEQCSIVLSRVKNGTTYIEAGNIFAMPYSTVAHLVRGSRRKI